MDSPQHFGNRIVAETAVFWLIWAADGQSGSIPLAAPESLKLIYVNEKRNAKLDATGEKLDLYLQLDIEFVMNKHCTPTLGLEIIDDVKADDTFLDEANQKR